MTITTSITEAQIFQIIGTFLQQILDPSVAVVRGEVNRVPEPAGTDFVVMWPILTERLERNVDSYDTGAGTQSMMQPVKITIQLDVHGPKSADNSQIITTLWRDDYGTGSFTSICASIGSGIEVQPLYAEDRKQMPFMDAEQQIEERWIVQVVLQANPVVVVSQQFADVLSVTVISVDEKYPPV